MQYLLNNKILTESGGYFTILLNSSRFLHKLGVAQATSITKHDHDNYLWNNYDLRNFNDKKYNIILAYHVGRKKAKSITKKLKTLLSMYYNTGVINLVTNNIYCYKLLIHTSSNNFRYIGSNPNNYQLIDANGIKAIPDINYAIKQLIKVLSKCNSLTNIITFNTITKFYKLIHTHGLVLSTTNNIDKIIHTEEYWSIYLSDLLGYTINVSLKPLRKTPQTNSDQVVLNPINSNNTNYYEPVKQWLTYTFKSYKLAYINNQRDLDKWNNLTNTQKKQYVFGVLNSTRKYSPKWINRNHKMTIKDYQHHKLITKTINNGYMREFIGIRTSYTYSFNKDIHNINKYCTVVSYLRFKLALYGVQQQLSLWRLNKIDNNLNVSYYRYNNRSKIGGSSKHYGKWDFYNQELKLEHRKTSHNSTRHIQQLKLFNTPNKINYSKNNTKSVTLNYELKILYMSKQHSRPPILQIVSRDAVPLVILRRDKLRIIHIIHFEIKQNKKPEFIYLNSS